MALPELSLGCCARPAPADKGSLESFEWFDFQSCAACGGIYSSQCIRLPEDPVVQQYPQTTCAGAV